MMFRRADISSIICRVLNIAGFLSVQYSWGQKLPFHSKPT